ncbi:Hint domain-containing protein [Paracoccus halophilus]|uniref:Hint domain-containing protein n=1 Tax=Paracoccus halophilus TaxID=376733 RepID=A0A099F202_9RHOB|nr:Hint domain-containing protein [Paracoccus halophilus]KGJ04444.1 hypothetical protein IT41_09985 [Paracoccus halophilus]SFA54241.1 Hint domain-containing protein [Paracoccus halophilus]
MPTSTDVRAIALGTHRTLDTNEFRIGAERAGELVGMTFGSVDDPLAVNIFSTTLYDGNDDGTIRFDGPSGPRPNEYAVVDGDPHYIDTGILYVGTVTYMDGTSASNVPLRILQDTDGNLALAPPPASASAYEIDSMTTLPIESITITGVLQNNFNTLDSSRYGLEDAPTFVCFRRGTLIRTPRGDVAVEDLQPGDLVITRDHGPQPLRWIGSKRVDSALLQAFATMRPVRIGAGALGKNLPTRDLYVSQQHRVLVHSPIARRMLGETEVLIAAKELTGLDGIEIDDSNEALEYFHLLFDAHEILCSEGALTESLFTGPEALKSVGAEARAEMMALFPQLFDDRAPARRIGKGAKARQLVRRHGKNRRELQEMAL